MKKNIISKSLLAVVFVIAYMFNVNININNTVRNDDLVSTISASTISFEIQENVADASSSFEKKWKKKSRRIEKKSQNRVINEIGRQVDDYIDDTVDAYLDPDSREFKERKAREALRSLNYGESQVVFHDAKVRSAFKRLVKNDPYTTIVSNLYEEGISYYTNQGKLRTKRGPLVGFVVRRTVPGQVTYVRGR